MPSRALAPAVLLALLGVATALAVVPAGRGQRLEVGGAYEGDLLPGPWSGAQRADVDAPAAADGITSFYYRAARPGCGFRLPFTARGPLRLTLRARALVRSAVSVYAGRVRSPERVVEVGPWRSYAFDLPTPEDAPRLEVVLAFRPLPLVPGDHGGNPEILVDFAEVESPSGLRRAAGTAALLGTLPVAAALLCRLAGAGAGASGAVALATALAAVGAAWLLPFSAHLLASRLAPLAALAGLAASALLRGPGTAPADRLCLALLVGAGTLVHGALPFLPNHNPPDVEIHVRRTVDLGLVPWDYQALLRYGSQLPTPSQQFGQATAALGDSVLLPYSPLPYVAYYALYRLGADPHWMMTALNAALVLLAAPLLWLGAREVWGRGAAWTSVLLYALDLAVWHRVGRSHAPAAFGGALMTAALGWLLWRGEGIDRPRRLLGGAALLAAAALGYSSAPVLLGLTGIALFTLLAVDARALVAAQRRATALAWMAGGLVAGALYYFHYVPGLLAGGGSVEAGPDLFPGRTFLVFHNESRQSMRLWAMGFWIPLGAGLACAPYALQRARASARPLLVSWAFAWAAVMLLKEPFLFPKLLRWAKEDQFVSPLLCLFVGAAAASITARGVRLAAVALAILAALWLQVRDYALHADSLAL